MIKKTLLTTKKNKIHTHTQIEPTDICTTNQ